MICPRCQKEIAEGSNFCYFCGERMAPAAAPGPVAAPPGGEPLRLVRSVTDRKLGGVCAGLADYLGMDVSLVRVLAVLSVLFYGFGLIAYLVAWIVIPEGSAVPGPHMATPPSRRLHRSMTDRKIGGVCGGLAEFLEAADLVKYAGQQPELGQLDLAIARAHEFVNLQQSPAAVMVGAGSS